MRAPLLRLLAIPVMFFSTQLAAQPAAPAGGHVPPPGASVPPMQGLTDLPGVVSWNTLAKVKQIKTKDRILPEFTQDVLALNNKEVKLQGFMMPLEPGEKQKHFLISLNSQSCSFCLPAGPEGVVEVKSKTPIKFTAEPIIVSGRMSVLKDDPMGLYYRLTDASPATAVK